MYLLDLKQLISQLYATLPWLNPGLSQLSILNTASKVLSYLVGGHRWMHVRGEGSRPNYPVGRDAVGRGVEPIGGDKVVSHCNDKILHTLGLQRIYSIKPVVLTHSVRLWWGHRWASFLPWDKKTKDRAIMRLLNLLYHKHHTTFSQKPRGRKEINSQSPHLSSRAGRSADTFPGSDASSGLHQQIYITKAQAALHQLENIVSC